MSSASHCSVYSSFDFFRQPCAKRFALCYQTVRCLSVCLSCPVLSCLSVTFVHCGQTVGRIKMKLGMQVGIVPSHIVLDGDPAPLLQRAQPPIFGPYLLRPNGCMNQDVTWYGARPRPRRLCVRWGPRSPSPKTPSQVLMWLFELLDSQKKNSPNVLLAVFFRKCFSLNFKYLHSTLIMF